MIGRPTGFLGLAFSDRGIACAEVSAGGEQRTIRRTATFTFTADHSLEKPEAAGSALAAFLREKRFTASRVVAGVPARWLIASEKELPPANEAQARAALQMQAERVAVGESGDVVFDYAGTPNPQASSRVLLVGIVRTQLDRVQRLLDAAGLSIAAITSTGLAISTGAKQAEGDAAMLILNAGGGEMVLRQAGGARSLRHVAVAANGHGLPIIAPLGAELRRAVALAQSNGTAATRQMLLLDGVGLPADQIADLSTRIGVEVRGGDELRMFGLTADAAAVAQTASGESRPIGYFAPAVSLALSASKPDALPLDFAHSRLAVAPKRRLSRNALIGIAAGLLVIIGVTMLYWQVNKSQNELDDINNQLAAMKQRADPAKTLVDRETYARGYFDSRPPALDCLRQFSSTLHDDDKIWVTTFLFHDNGKGQLSGKAADQDTVLAVYNRLKKNSAFTQVQLPDVHEADARTHEWTFTLNFTFNLVE